MDFTEISDHKFGKHFFHIPAEWNRVVFSAEPHLRQNLAETERRRQGRR